MLARQLAIAIAVLVAVPAAAQTPPPSPALWGARAPAKCTPLKTAAPPTAAQAAQLFRCFRESASMSSGELWLTEKVVLKLGAAKLFRDMYNVYTMPEADTTKAVYPISGSWTWAVCILKADAAKGGDADHNCRESDVTGAEGACWVTRADGWKCNMSGSNTATRQKTLPPR